MITKCMRPIDRRWQEPISTYHNDYKGILPIKQLEKPLDFDAFPSTTYKKDYKGEIRPRRHWSELPLYQNQHERKKSDINTTDWKPGKKCDHQPLNNLYVLGIDPNKVCEELREEQAKLSKTGKRGGFQPSKLRCGVKWPISWKMMEEKYPYMDMYVVDKLANHLRWTSTARQQMEDVYPSGFDPEKGELSFARKADPVSYDTGRYYPGPQEWQHVDFLDRHQWRDPVPRYIPPVDTTDPFAKMIKKKLEIRHDNLVNIEQAKLERVRELVDNNVLPFDYIKKTVNFAGFVPRLPTEPIDNGPKPPDPTMQTIMRASYRSFPMPKCQADPQHRRQYPFGKTLTTVRPYNPFTMYKGLQPPLNTDNIMKSIKSPTSSREGSQPGSQPGSRTGSRGGSKQKNLNQTN